LIGVKDSRLVMAGLVPALHVLAIEKEGVDARDKPGHDDAETSVPASTNLPADPARQRNIRI
jgi:hypothetical protein